MFKVRKVGIDSHPENMAFLLRGGGGYSTEQFRAMRKIGGDTLSEEKIREIISDIFDLAPGRRV